MDAAATRSRLRPAAATDFATVAVAGCVLVGALLRFATLGRQSFEAEEAYTLRLLDDSFTGMLRGVADQESTPPVYYVLVWIWSKAFGSGEVAVRSLSALAGTIMVYLAYRAAAALLRRRWPAVAVSALVAASPILVWYSQETRAYALYACLGSASLLFFARSWETPTGANTWGWAAASALTLGTHYFAGFLVLAEALLLLGRHGRRVAAPLAAVGVAAAAVIPLAVHQYASAEALRSVTSGSLGWRLKEVALRFVFFFYNPGGDAALAVAIVVAALLVLRGTRRAAGARRSLTVAAFTVAAPLLLAATHVVDVFFFRNVLAAWLPLAIAVAGGLAGLRIAPAVALVAVAVLLVSTLQITRKVELQRDSWRNAVSALKDEPRPFVLVSNDSVTPPVYWRSLRSLPASGVETRREVVAGRYVTEASAPSGGAFTKRGFRQAGNIGILELEATRPQRIDPRELAASGLTAWLPPVGS